MFRATLPPPVYSYEANFVEWDCCWHIASLTAGSGWNSIASRDDVGLQTGTWVKITTEIVGTSMRILLNDAQTVPSSGWTSVGTAIPAGTMGFRAWTISGGHFWRVDDVRARKAASPAPQTTIGPPTCFSR